MWQAIAAIAGGLLQSNSASKAAKSQAAADANAIAEQRRQFDLTREDYAPYREAGVNALQRLVPDVNRYPTAAEVMSSPGYQFGLSEGQRALDRQFARGGGRISGAAMRAGTRYATNYATSGYNAEWQRRQDRLNRLAAIAGIGQTATGGSAMAGANSANAISGLLSSGGDAQAASQLQRGSIWGNTINQLGAQFGREPARASWGPLDSFFYGNGGSGD